MSHEPASVVFDRAKFIENTMDDKELMRDLVATLEQSWPKSEAELRQAVAAGDAAALERAAHKVKGAVGAFFAGPARQTAAELESMGDRGTTSGAAPLLDKLAGQVRTLLEALRQLAG